MEIGKTQKYYKVLGRGTFGHVFLGEDTKNNIPVAIKVIPLERFKQQPERIIPSLKNEIKNMQMLNHKNVVQLYNVVKTENNLYMIVEFCNQGNLERLIKQKNLSEEKCINIMCQIIEGFRCLNSNNIAHRDLKPENILLHNRTVKIADFGFSKVIESGMDEPILYSFVGTPLYMSPQILQKQNYSSKTDIWSLGMLFYELLYSRRPWDGKGYFDLLDNILKKPLQFPPLPKVHQQTKNIITKMLQIKEEDRINWEDLFQFFSIENLHTIYSDQVGNSNQQQKDLQNLQLHQLYDQNCNSRIPHHPSSPTSTVSMKSERIDEEDKFSNVNVQTNDETNLNRVDEESQSDNSNNGLQQTPNIQNQRSSDSNDDEVMNDSQMNNLLEYFTSNVNMAQQFQLVLQLQQLLNKKRGQKLTINEVKQMVMGQIKPQNQNTTQQINQQQNTQMRGGLFAQTNPMFQNQLFNLQTNNQNNSNQKEQCENNNSTQNINNNGNDDNNIHPNMDNHQNINNNNHLNGYDNNNNHTNESNQSLFNKNDGSSCIDEID